MAIGGEKNLLNFISNFVFLMRLISKLFPVKLVKLTTYHVKDFIVTVIYSISTSKKKRDSTKKGKGDGGGGGAVLEIGGNCTQNIF